MKNQLLLFLVLAGITFSSCNNDDDPAATKGLNLSINNLATSASEEQYEGWIIVDGAPVSTGTFTVDENGNLSQSTFQIDAGMLDKATTFVLTIEPVPDNDPAPSSIKILGGDFSGSQASVTVSHAAALGDDFSSASGTVILATPTTETTEDELSGIWFLDLSSGSPATGLSLPALPANWKYEGWAVIDGQPVTSGTFSTVNVADDSAPFSGPDMGPPFPGEDYITNEPDGLSFPTDISGMVLVISIEPNPDNDPAPFLYKPLVVTLPTGAQDHVNYDLMNNVSSTFPTGTVSR
ncbi:MAG: anti-sigma factor [Bacteroidetes bacterium]|nr:anti-sigma factor [Bacteroidota bacterium]